MTSWNKHPKHAAPKAAGGRVRNAASGPVPNASSALASGGAPVTSHAGAPASAPAGPSEPAWGGSRVAAAVFLVLVLGLSLVPFVGMAWAPTTASGENRELAAAPAPFAEDGSFNWKLLADTGAYFDDHFAYRNQIVTANARLRALLGTSATDQVVVGADGWLYYGGTLPDYLGQSALSDRALRNIAHNMKLAQDYVESHGGRFAFTVAPNKNSLYPQHMPAYYLKSPESGNAARLRPFLEEAGVNYVDLFSLFADSPAEWYLKGDSHWDNRGAAMAADALLAAVGHGASGADPDAGLARRDFTGDLEGMLHPAGPEAETNWYFEGFNDDPAWSYAEGADVTDSWVRTQLPEGAGSLLMFRDSFGNALLPFAASSYGDAAFSKLVPYNLPAMGQVRADAVIVERAERHLPYLAENPPIMFSPEAPGDIPEIGGAQEPGAAQAPAVTVEGSYLKIVGAVDSGRYADDASIYIGVRDASGTAKLYDAFWVSLDASADGDAAQGRGASSAAEPTLQAAGASGGEEIVNDFGYQAYLKAEGVDLGASTVFVVVESEGEREVAAVFDGLETIGD